MKVPPNSNPTSSPPANSLAMDTLVRNPKITIGMEGGMITPMEPPAATTAAAKAGGYPCRIMAGMTTAPMAAVSAAAEPEIPAKNMEATIHAQASPPGTQPTRLSEKSMSCREMPPVSMMDPASMNNGTARRSNESTPAKRS